MFASLFLQFWGKWFALCPHLSHGSKKSCWFFSLFSCLLLRIEWWLPSSLHVKLEVPRILSELNSCTQYSCMMLKYSNLLNEGANFFFFFLRGLVIWSIFEMRVISLHILDKAQERSWKAFAKNKDSEQSCEYVIIFNSIKMKSVYSFHATLQVYECMPKWNVCFVFPTNRRYIQCTFYDLHVGLFNLKFYI